MKKIFYAVLFSFVITGALAQDVIVKKSGEELTAKVVKVGSVEIEYKKVDNADGPVYTIPRTEIFMIKYANGSKDVINDLNTPKASSAKSLKSYIAVTAGVGIPVGKFGSSNKDDSESGFASTGLDLNVSYFVPLSSWLGAGIKIGTDIHSIDQGNLYAAEAGSTWSYYTSDVGSVSRKYFMAGLIAVLPAEKVSLDVHAFGGIASTLYPGYTLYGYEYMSGTAITNTFSSATSSAPVYNIGLGVAYPFADKWSAMLSVDFISSYHEFNGTETHSASYFGYNYLYENVSVTFHKPVSVFSATAGVAYTIGK